MLKEERECVRNSHAMNCIVNKACAMVGRPSNIRPFNRALMFHLLDNPLKLDNSIFINVNEFHHLLVPFTAGMQAVDFIPIKIGFHGKALIITDTLGSVVEVIPFICGNTNDNLCFHMSKTFRRVVGFQLELGNTILGDSLFTGHVISDLRSAECAHPYSLVAIAAVPCPRMQG